jgi:hypothetical protein
MKAVPNTEVYYMVKKQSDINQQNSIRKHLWDCHTPVVSDRAADFPIQNFWKGKAEYFPLLKGRSASKRRLILFDS